MAIEWPKQVTVYGVRKYTLIHLGHVQFLVLISYLKGKQLINNRFYVILGIWNSSGSRGVRNFERYELKSESMQPAHKDSQRIVMKCQAGRDEMRRVTVLLVFVCCFLIETVRTRVCLELQRRKECQLNVLSTDCDVLLTTGNVARTEGYLYWQTCTSCLPRPN